MPADPLTIFLGAPIEEPSERHFLRDLIKSLSDDVPTIILCNFHLQGRQVDCVVATASGVALIEVKSSALPLRGSLNGDWQLLLPSGDWQRYRNPYQQALDAKNRLRDAMNVEVYPAGFVAIVGDLPAGSEVTPGDFKVRVLPAAQAIDACLALRGGTWDVAAWRGFAERLNLRQLSVEEVLSPGLASSLAWEDDLRAASIAEHQSAAARWVPETPEQAEQALEAAGTQAGLSIVGPSGCGKSLLARWLTVELSRAGRLCLLITAKDFTGSWSETLRRELALLSTRSEVRLLFRGEAPPVLLLDGVNELAPELAVVALRGLRALARRYGARVVVVSQTAIEGFAGLARFELRAPSQQLKERIAARTGALAPTAVQLLDGVHTGLEADIVGQMSGELVGDQTRLNLVDQFMRARLTDRARPALAGLRRLAAHLIGKLAYSINETDFDEFMASAGVSYADCDRLFAVKLLERRAGRVTFAHELFQSCCAARSLAKLAETDVLELAIKLTSPQFASMATDVMAAIESPQLAYDLLALLAGAELIASAADGELGPAALTAATKLLDQSRGELITQIEQSSLAITEGKPFARVVWAGEETNLRPPQTARLLALGLRAGTGTGVDAYMALCAAMDARLLSERRRLAEVARAAQIALRSESFSLAYYGMTGHHPFTTVSRAAEGSGLSRRTYRPQPPRSLLDLSSGQLHYVLRHRYDLFKADGDAFVSDLIEIIRNRWRFEPYHVRLEVLTASGFARDIDGDLREQLVAAINTIETHPSEWGINSAIIDALKFLGALDDEAEQNRVAIREEIARALTEAPPAGHDLALSVYTRMFDHPFDGIYGEEIYGLSDDDRFRLYRRALASKDVLESFSPRILASEVAALGDPADEVLFAPLAVLPSQSNPFSQDEFAAFVQAVRFLARHQRVLPFAQPANEAQKCMLAVRALIYAAESQREVDLAMARHQWEGMGSANPNLVAACLADVNDALMTRDGRDAPTGYPALNLAAAFPTEVLALCRRVFSEPATPASYHNVPIRERVLSFVFDVIRASGDRSDLDRLRALVDDPKLGSYAVRAMRDLESARH